MSLFRNGEAAPLRVPGPVRPTRFGRLPPIQSPAGGVTGAREARPAVGRRTRRNRARSQDSRLRHVDWVLVLAVLGLALMGTLLVWSATRPGLAYLEKQLLNLVLGVVLMAVVAVIDYRWLRVYAPFVFVATVLGLMVVLSPLGTTVYGAHSWIALPGGFEIEPSEFAKLGLVLVVALILGDMRNRTGRPRFLQVAAALVVGAIPLLLVVLQPDLGVTILMLVILVGMVALSGIRLRWLATMAAAGALGIAAIFSLHLLKAYQLQRLTSFLHPSSATSAAGYNALQSKIMVGSGGMFGQGLFHGQLVAGSFVPNQQTDFIFAVAGEELGFVGASVIVGLLAIVLLRTLRIASRADDLFGLLVASGIGIWFAVQSFINIGMTIGVTPVTGLPLPFVSYGGSAMFADMMAVGVLLAIHRRHHVFA